MARRKRRPKSDPKGQELLDELLAAARSLGWFVADTEEEVTSLEERDDEERVTTLRSLPDPYAVLDGKGREKTRKQQEAPEPLDLQVEESLARVAREGEGELPADVVRRMKKDRQRAEESAAEQGRE